MNTYNDNLHNNVVTSLQEQEISQKKMKAKLDAAVFSLYYAEGAQITASEKLNKASSTFATQQKVQEQAVNCANVATNVLASATQEKQYVAQFVTNSAVSAANVQVAANAIIKLSSDIASIFSITSAADFDSEIFKQAKHGAELMDRTAYKAALTSQHAMETSAMAAEISAGTVSDMATTTNASVENLLAVLTNELNTTNQVVTSDNTALTTASIAEKKAEGILEDVNVEYYANQAAYNLSNRELNLNLQAVPVESQTDTHYRVSFNPLENPFKTGPSLTKELKVISPIVQDYYILLVKDTKKATFSLSMAEELIKSDTTSKHVPAAGISKSGLGPFVLSITDIKDSDNEKMDLGKNYVVFIMAVYSPEYKKALNNFEDFLSAPSMIFRLATSLSTATPRDIGDGKKEAKYISVGEKGNQLINFEVTADNDYTECEYRCMLLPMGELVPGGMLTNAGLRLGQSYVKDLQDFYETKEPGMAKAQAEMNTYEAQLDVLKQEEEELKKKVSSLKTEIEKEKKDKEKKKNLELQLVELNKQQKAQKKRLDQAKNNHETASAEFKKFKESLPMVTLQDATVIPFFFNKILAEQVNAGNYIAIEGSDFKNRLTDNLTLAFKLLVDTTDNFGNRLVPGMLYLPAVLTIFNGEHDLKTQFINALSSLTNLKPFTYTVATGQDS